MAAVMQSPAFEALDSAIYLALCEFYGDNRAVGATEAVLEVILREFTLVTKCGADGLVEVLELEVQR